MKRNSPSKKGREWSWKGIQSLPPLLGRVGRKTRFGIFNISLQETYLRWPVSTLEFL